MPSPGEEPDRPPGAGEPAAHPLQPGGPVDLTAVDSRHPGHPAGPAGRPAAGRLRPEGGRRGGDRPRLRLAEPGGTAAIWDDTLAESGAGLHAKVCGASRVQRASDGPCHRPGQGRRRDRLHPPDFPYDGICGAFRRTAAAYGFIERYQRGKEALTGIAPEPWHFRYVGTPHALLMDANGLCWRSTAIFCGRGPAPAPCRAGSGPGSSASLHRRGDGDPSAGFLLPDLPATTPAGSSSPSGSSCPSRAESACDAEMRGQRTSPDLRDARCPRRCISAIRSPPCRPAGVEPP